jgi:diguanylate cyclase (GGDEF)-like protein/PAS domain S-box-containing protein
MPRFDTWSLKAKFALCSGALMFAFSVAFTSWTLRAREADVRSSVIDAQRALVRATANDIDEKIELRRDAMRVIAGLLPALAPAAGPQMEAFFEARPVLNKMFDEVLVVDAAGRVIRDMPPQIGSPTTGSSIADRDYFKQIIDGAPLVISSPQRALAGREPFVVFAAALHARDGRFSGALVCVLNLTRPNFLGNLGTVRIGQAGYFALAEQGPSALFVMHGDRKRIMTPVSEHLALHSLAGEFLGDVGHLIGVDDQGVETLRSFTPLRAVPWMLVAVYPTAEAFTGLQAREREVLAVGGGLLAIGSVVAWLMSGWLLRPLTRLRGLMDRHASDPGLAIPPDNFGSTELAELVLAYNAQASSRRQFEERLKASERRVHDITDNLPVLIAYIDRSERYTFVNATFKHWLGKDPAEVVGRTMVEVLGRAAYDLRRPPVQRCLAGERVTFDTELDTLSGKKCLQNEYIPDFAPDGAVAGCYVLSSDVTELKNAQHRLGLLVRRDALTGLDNRYQFNEALPLARMRSARSGTGLAVMFVDIDHFKQINDSYGHATGDLALKEFAQRLRHSVRSTDTVARLGGDEFVVILEGLHDSAEPQLLARNILRAISRPFDIGGRVLALTTSIGIAFHSTLDVTDSALLAEADAALYDAKISGRNTFRMPTV